MKKLMTMIAAVATAFGLYADDALNNSVDFAEYDNVNPWTLTQKDGETPDTLWAWAGTATDPATDEAKIESGELVLSTGSNVLSRKFAADATAIDDGLFVDMVLDYNGEALDTIPTVESGKIAIFALDQTEIEGIPEELKAQTNVYVLANYGEDGKALYRIKTFDFDTPRRVALKAYENVITGEDADARAGFLVYMGAETAQLDKLTPAVATAVYAFDEDGKVVWTDVKGEEPNYLGRSDVMSSKWVKGKNLFISLDADPQTSAKLTSVDFVGRAKLASITLTDDSTDWPADDVRMAVELTDAEITDITGAELMGDELVADDNDVEVTFKAAPLSKDNVTVDYTGTISGPDEDGVYTITFNEANTLTVTGWDTAATVGDTKFPYIFGDDPDTCAIAYVNANGGTLKLAKPVEATESLVFNGANEIVLDLNGKAITFDGEGEYAETISNNGVLTIIDSDDGGSVAAGTGTYAVSVGNYGTLTIEDGIFLGGIYNEAELAITGGKFDVAIENDNSATIVTTGGAFNDDVFAQDEIPGVDYTTYEAVPGTEDLLGYWVVQVAAPKTYVAQIGEDKYESLAEAFAAAADGDKIEVIDDCTIDERINVAAAGRSITLDATDFTVTCNCLYPIVWGDYTEQNAGTLTVVGGTFQQDTEPNSDGNPAMILWTKNGKIKVTGGTFNVTKGEGQVAYVGGADAVNGSIEVTGGAFAICDKASGDKGDVFNVQNTLNVTQIKVSGGTFTKDLDLGDDYIGPTFVADGYASTFNSDLGLWQVVPAAVKVGNKGFVDAATALAAVQALEAAGTYPITVTALVDDLAVAGPGGQTITLAKDATISITAAGWAFDGTVAGEVTLAAGKSITVLQGSTLKVNAPAGYKVVKDTETTPGFWIYTVEEVTYVAQIGTAKFETIEAAVAAANADDEITLLTDCAITSTITMKATVGLYIDKNITINCGGYTLTGPTGEAVYGIVIGADVTISNGTIVAAANSSLINIGNAGDFGEAEFEGNLTLDNVVVEGKGPNNNGNSIAAAKGTVTIDNGCRFTKLGTRGIKAEGTASVTINDATIDLENAYSGTISVYAKETGSITINGGSIAGTIEKAGDAVITIPGTSKATFNRDQTAFCVTGYKTKELTTGVWSVVQIQYATLTINTVENCTIVVKDADGAEVKTGAEFDVDDAAKLTVTRTADQYYVLVGCEPSEEITMNDDQTVTAAVAKETKLYYADLYVDGTLSEVPVQLGTGDHIYPWGVQVPATHAGVMVNPEFIPAADGTWYVSKLVLKGDPNQTWEFEYDGTTLTRKSGTEDVTIGAGNVLSYTVTTGHDACFGEVYLTKYEAEPEVPVIDPTKPSDPMDADKADAAVEEINKNPAKYIKAPDEFGELDPTDMATYQGYFMAKKVESTTQLGKYDVVLELNSDGQTALQNSVNGDVVKIKPAEIAAGTATNVKIDAIPGFYYGVKAGNGLGTMAIKSSVPAMDAELTLDLPKFDGSGFYTVVASPTPMAVAK